MKWPLVELGSVAEVSSGDGAPQEASAFGKSGTPFIRAGSLSTLLDGVPENELELIPVHESSRRRMRTYPPRTIVFAKSGMSCTKGLIYEIKSPAHVVNHLAALECGGDLHHRFLLRWFEVNSPSRLIANPSYPSIKISDIRSEKIPLPPLAEQKRIAAILDAADALRAKRREALAQLDALLQSSFLTLFGDPVSNPMGWPMAAMGSQLKVIGGYAFKSEDFQEGGLPVIRISNLNKDSIDLDGCARIPKAKVGKGEKFRIIAGDTLIAMSGATTGKLGLVPDDLQDEWYLNQRVGAFRLSGNSQIHREYLRALLASPFYQRHVLNLAGGAAQPNISGAQLESAEIPLPPLPLQQKFAAIVESIERQKTTQRAHLAELDALFAALQHRAFRGEL